MNIKFTLLLLLLALGALGQTKKEAGSRVIIAYNIKIADSLKNEIRRVVDLYDQKYGLPYKVLHIKDSILPPAPNPTGGVYHIAFAYTAGQNIYFERNEIDSWNVKIIGTVIKHELFHTITDGYTMIEPVKISDSSEFVSFQGLSLILKFTSGKISFLTAIDEAAAEYCAEQLEPNYFYISDDSYSAVRLLLKELIDRKYISIADVITYEKSNNWAGFVKKVLNKEAATERDFLNLYGYFNTVYESPSIEIVYMAGAGIMNLRKE